MPHGLLFGTELFFVPLAVALYVLFTGDPVRRIIALQVAGMFGALVLTLLSIVFAQPAFAELGLCAAILGTCASITYAHFMERWL